MQNPQSSVMFVFALPALSHLMSDSGDTSEFNGRCSFMQSLTIISKLRNAASNLHNCRGEEEASLVQPHHGAAVELLHRSTAINGVWPPAGSRAAVQSCMTHCSISLPGCPGPSTVVSLQSSQILTKLRFQTVVMFG